MGSWRISMGKNCGRSKSNQRVIMNTISYRLGGLRRFEKPLLLLLILTPLTLGACGVCGVRWGELWRGIGDSATFVARLRPEWGAFGDMWQPALVSVLIAFVGTLVGTLFSILFAFA